MIDIVSKRHTITADGVAILPAVLTSDEIDAIKAEVSVDHETMRRTGIRNLEKTFGSIARVAAAPSVLSIAASLLGRDSSARSCAVLRQNPGAKLVCGLASGSNRRAKPPTRNARLGPWTNKDGVDHVQPPLAVLNQMVTMRLHVDDADEEWSCLRVITDCHRLGILTQDEIVRTAAASTPKACVVASGDAGIMRPLIPSDLSWA